MEAERSLILEYEVCMAEHVRSSVREMVPR